MKKQHALYLLLFTLITIGGSFCLGMADHGAGRYQFRLALELGTEMGPITFIKLLPSFSVVAFNNHNQGIALRKGYKERRTLQLDDDVSTVNDAFENGDLITIQSREGDFLFSWNGTRDHTTPKGKGSLLHENQGKAPRSVSWKKIQDNFEELSFKELFLSYSPAIILHHGAFCSFYDPAEDRFYTKKAFSPTMRRGEEILVGTCSWTDVNDRELLAPDPSTFKIPTIYSYTILGQWLLCGHANGIISVWEDLKYCTVCETDTCEWSLHDELSKVLTA